MCFGSSDDSSSRRMIDMQQEEARQARLKETQRQARIKSGLARIKGAFEGTPVMGRRTVAVPAGTKQVTGPATTRRVWVEGGSGVGGGRGTGGGGYYKTVTVPGVKRAVTTPAGTKVVSYDTGKTTGGIGDPFYNKFKQGILDYYQPQVAEKYGEAKNETNFRLANAGTLNSTAAIMNLADLVKQNELRTAEVRSKADTAAADLKSRVAAERAKAENQLYATENPDVAANQALAGIRNITAEKPDNTPLGDIFNIAAIGGANYLKGGSDAYYRNKYVPGASAGGRVVA